MIRSTNRNGSTGLALAVGTLLAGLLSVLGCEDGGLLLPSDGNLVLEIGPSQIVIDNGSGEEIQRTTLTAQLFHASAFPAGNTDVTFSSNGGTLASGGATLRTNAQGLVSDTLTLTLDDAATVEVTARSALVSETREVRNSLLGNAPPTPMFTIDPPTTQFIGLPITLDGTLSEDIDGDDITCHYWRINSSLGLQEIYGDPAPVVIFQTAQLSVSFQLFVSDDPAAAGPCRTGGPVNSALLYGPETVSGYVVSMANQCDFNQAPNAEAGPAQSLPLAGGVAQFSLNGIASADAETPLAELRYEWECLSGGVLTPDPAQPYRATCTYSTAGIKSARLTVRDDGNGDCFLNGDDTMPCSPTEAGCVCECEKVDTDAVTLTVTNPI